MAQPHHGIAARAISGVLALRLLFASWDDDDQGAELRIRQLTGSFRAVDPKDPVVLRFEGGGLGFVSHAVTFDFQQRRVRHCRTFLRLCSQPHLPDLLPLGDLRGFRLRPLGNRPHPLREALYVLEYFDARYRAHTLGRVGLSALLPLIEQVDRIAEQIGRPFLVPRSFLESIPEAPPPPVSWLRRAMGSVLSSVCTGATLQNIRSRLSRSQCARSLP